MQKILDLKVGDWFSFDKDGAPSFRIHQILDNRRVMLEFFLSEGISDSLLESTHKAVSMFTYFHSSEELRQTPLYRALNEDD